MIRQAGAIALLSMAWTDAVTAQEFKGAEISAELLTFRDAEDFTATNYRGSVEMGVMGGFGLQADLSFYNLEDADTARSINLHVLTDAFPAATLGAFYGRDSVGDGSASILGVEAGMSAGPMGGEAYAGFGDADGTDFSVLGFDGAFDVTPAISVTASGARLGTDDGSLGRVSVGGEYRFGESGPAVYAEVGRLGAGSGGDGDSSGFLGIGARLALGPNRGTTFESRSYFEVLGSF